MREMPRAPAETDRALLHVATEVSRTKAGSSRGRSAAARGAIVRGLRSADFYSRRALEALQRFDERLARYVRFHHEKAVGPRGRNVSFAQRDHPPRPTRIAREGR